MNNTSTDNIPSKPVVTIRPSKGWLQIDFKELWLYRELAYFFVWRDVKVRYKQTVVGVLWAILQPFFTMVVYSVLFGRLAKMPSDGIPYPVFVYVGLIFWNYFAFGLSHSSNSMVSNANIIQKIYFPRLIVPISSSLIGLVDFAIASVILLGIMFYYKYIPHLEGIIYIPFLLFITFLSSVGLGCFLASLNVKYRDVQYVIPFFMSTLMFLTPVIYPVSLVGDKFKWILALNPMAAVIETARGTILGTRQADWRLLSISIAISLVLYVVGIMYFRKTERYFADVI